MDALYVFKHSPNDDFEIRYSLRSIEQYAPYIRKVWIYGDKPEFISEDTSLIEHVPHEATSRVLGVKTPVTNFFLLIFLSSLIPDLSFEYLFFCDDFYFLKPHSIEESRKDRYLEDLAQAKSRGRGLWKDSLWRTFDLLTRLGYSGYNFETHTPGYLTRKRVMDAYCDFKDFITEDRFYGMLGLSAILNHAYKREKMKLTHVAEEKSRFGFWGKPPAFEDVVQQSAGKMYFNFDDPAFGESIQKFLMERFPTRSRYEKE
jgi:Stealth protein CR2, conserved region 2